MAVENCFTAKGAEITAKNAKGFIPLFISLCASLCVSLR